MYLVGGRPQPRVAPQLGQVRVRVAARENGELLEVGHAVDGRRAAEHVGGHFVFYLLEIGFAARRARCRRAGVSVGALRRDNCPNEFLLPRPPRGPRERANILASAEASFVGSQNSRQNKTRACARLGSRAGAGGRLRRRRARAVAVSFRSASGVQSGAFE